MKWFCVKKQLCDLLIAHEVRSFYLLRILCKKEIKKNKGELTGSINAQPQPVCLAFRGFWKLPQEQEKSGC